MVSKIREINLLIDKDMKRGNSRSEPGRSCDTVENWKWVKEIE
jgi:hypothetical protein